MNLEHNQDTGSSMGRGTGTHGRIAAVFNDSENAKKALDELRNAGVPRSSMRLVSGDSGKSKPETQSDDNNQGFFSWLFGMDDSERQYDQSRDDFGEDHSYFSGLTAGGKCLLIIENDAPTASLEPIIKRNGGNIDENVGSRYRMAKGRVEKMTLYAEQLRAEKQRVQTGEVHIRKDVVSEIKTIEVPVEREEIVIERRLVDGARRDPLNDSHKISASGMNVQEEIRIPVSEERISVHKETVPVEEVEVKRETSTEVRTLTDTVSHEEARIESDGHAEIRNKTQHREKPKNNRRPQEAPVDSSHA